MRVTEKVTMQLIYPLVANRCIDFG